MDDKAYREAIDALNRHSKAIDNAIVAIERWERARDVRIALQDAYRTKYGREWYNVA